MQQLELQIGLDAILSYRRLSYTAWHALAEFVDNSTQAYFNNQVELDPILSKEGRTLEVRIAYDRKSDILRISDNSIGMSYEELENALHVANPPAITTGRSKYGMGMKTASCWIGDRWSIRTKKLGESIEHTAVVDVESIAAGDGSVQYTMRSDISDQLHYTVIEIRSLNREWHGRTLGKIRDYLRSMYREDFRKGILKLVWQDDTLIWKEPEFLSAEDGTPYRKDFRIKINGHPVRGWIGILSSGSRAEAGFSIIHSGRVIKGWPDSWRPASLFGHQVGGTNNLVNQRLVGEIHLDGFEVSHTKDDILWRNNEEQELEEQLGQIGALYRSVANSYRAGSGEGGPTEPEKRLAISTMQEELESPEMIDAIKIMPVVPPNVARDTFVQIAADVTKREPDFHVSRDETDVEVSGFLSDEMSPLDPYFIVHAPQDHHLQVIINQRHPHWKYLDGNMGVLNYLRHCTFDALAEWKAAHLSARVDETTVKLFKDHFLRVPFEIEMRSDHGEVEQTTASVVQAQLESAADSDA